ncbi:olfactory receptor 8U3-like [Ambystoma mexicanum]|uniref:olfactory receptor 8U3-like n=1 Tax=Ambystoma mexicanum TaxID=8296 RepID=UPI0037E7DDCB
MKEVNQTLIKEFILQGLTNDPDLQMPLFLVFILVYIITVLGNVGIIILIKISPRLHTPMYFLLSNLSFADLCCSSIVTPTMLIAFLSQRMVISLAGCAIQMFLFVGMGSTEVFLLTMMAYDRYIAVCKPLRYSVIMNNTMCLRLVVAAYSVAFLDALIQTNCTFRLNFCGSNEITHFYCDIPPMLKISCSDTGLNEAVLMCVAGGLIVAALVIVLTSYTFIVAAILRIQSSDGRRRAISTCSTHFFCVTLLFGTLVFMYCRPRSQYSMDQDRVASVFYMLIIPMINPLIYSLRNQEVKLALRKVGGRTCVLR